MQLYRDNLEIRILPINEGYRFLQLFNLFIMISTFSLQNGVVSPANVSLVPSDRSKPSGDTHVMEIFDPLGVKSKALL